VKLKIKIEADLPTDAAALSALFAGMAGMQVKVASQPETSRMSTDDFFAAIAAGEDTPSPDDGYFQFTEEDSASEPVVQPEPAPEAQPDSAPAADRTLVDPTAEEDASPSTDPMTVKAMTLLATQKLKPTTSVGLPDGTRAEAGTEVKWNGDDYVVLATARGYVVLVGENNKPFITNVSTFRSEQPETEAVEPGPTDTKPAPATDGIEDAVVVDEAVTFATLRRLGELIQTNINAPAVFAAISAVCPGVMRLGLVPEDKFPALAAEMTRVLKAAGVAV
jgi:hypothetical protein